MCSKREQPIERNPAGCVSRKRYDREYFERWYRGKGPDPATLEREAAVAVALTEHVLEREIETVLDVGAGEGRWLPVLRSLRPDIQYLGVEPSEWAVSHWGRRRNLIYGDILSLAQLGIPGPYDLVIVADVLHYLPTPVLRRGLQAVAPFVEGLLFAPAFTRDDPISGDLVDFQPRREDTYRKAFHEAGLRQVGPWSWTSRGRWERMAALERPPV
jgi:SAM-dependent methyltransferase